MKDQDARSIAQDFLDRQGEATICGDVEATLACCDIPCTLDSMEGRVVATNRAQMRAICAAFIDELKAKRLTHMVRKCLDAQFRDDDTVCALYETRYIKDNSLLSEEPYAGFVILRRKETQWKIIAMQFAVRGASPANITLRDWIRERSDL
ncbi:hypothetical protein [Tropicibacter oceani]|uniref:SnoaL-like domain-containing protein n=1 Tax=Tropicibacter oceani TaxID=3058420 RepID=A0ABY8QJH6_9RHOB|nr:hypothetical protein [Tropicibacter oceani]WGW04148.1 hypothetical protein QF118_00995 [Tropicibacter oceani]